MSAKEDDKESDEPILQFKFVYCGNILVEPWSPYRNLK